MQQTETYKLNLIETSDPFSPEPLNKNMEAVEAQLAAVCGEFAAADAGLSAQLAALDSAKAEQTALDAGLAALSGRVGTLEDGKLLWKYSTYTGDGTCGKSKPTRLEFDFKPIALIIGHSGDYRYGGSLWLRPMTRGRSCQSSTGVDYMTLGWEDRAVWWYSSYSNATAQDQLNTQGVQFH